MLQAAPMVSLDAARAVARRVHEALYYEGTCKIIEYRPATDSETKITTHSEVVAVEEQPCKLSYSGLSATEQSETAAAVGQSVKLFIAPEITINPGSKIVVTQHGVTFEYAVSGKPAVYPTHQEIELEVFRGWA